MATWCPYYIVLVCIIVQIISFGTARSTNDRRLLRVEPMMVTHLDIAPRPEAFFEKRSMSPNPVHIPYPHTIQHDDILRLVIQAYNSSFALHLFPNEHLLHPNAVLYHGDGRQEALRPEQFRIYRGYAVHPYLSEQRWIEDQLGIQHAENMDEDQQDTLGWARLVLRHDIMHNSSFPLFEGAFRILDDTYHIKLKSNYKLAKRHDDAEAPSHNHLHMVVYRDSDTIHAPLVRRDNAEDTGVCGTEGSRPPMVVKPLDEEYRWGIQEVNDLRTLFPSASTLSKRAPPAGCPSSRKILYMGAAADCSYTNYYQTSDNARTQILNDWNSASAIYEEQMNIQLGLINITIMPENCPSSPSSDAAWNQGCSDSYSILQRLSDFSLWRSKFPNDGAGLWHLMTSCATGIEVGIAWMKQVCNTGATSQSAGVSGSDYPTGTGSGTEYVSGTGLSSIIRDEWKVVAHEIGHGFGAIHDCTSSTCPCPSNSCTQCCPLSSTQCDAGGTYIMNPSSNASASNFSPCSVQTICDQFPTLGTCLEDPGSRTILGLQTCGNGIKESGEDCDTAGKDTACCNAATCKFKPGAQCEDFNDLCCNNCTIDAANTVCRPAASVCDIAETCNGVSSDCPSDVYKDDGTSCGSNGLQCASGQCTSRDAQCQARGGSTMNVTGACSDAIGGCDLICSTPNTFSCVVFNGQFRDGTPCGVGGSCKNGSCDLGNFANNIKSWYVNNKQIAIPVTIVVGLVILLCLYCCLCRGYNYYRYRQSNAKQPAYAVMPMPPGYPARGPADFASSSPFAPPPPQHNNNNAPRGWVDPTDYNGPSSPSSPPPAYSNSQQRNTYEMNPIGPIIGRTSRISTPQPPPHSPQRPYNEGRV